MTTTFEIRTPDGQKIAYDANQLWAAITSASRIESITISAKETRERVKYQNVERFISAQSSYSNAWNLVDAIHDYTQRVAARGMLFQAIRKDVMEKEDWLYQMMQHMFGKDNSSWPIWRNPDNPYVKAVWDVQEVFTGGVTRNSVAEKDHRVQQ